jgi:hypothetical protein
MIEREVILAPPGEEDEEDVEQWDVRHMYGKTDFRMRTQEAAQTRKRNMEKNMTIT